MKSEPHRIFVCTSCRDKTTGGRPGPQLIGRLKSALRSVCPVADTDFIVSGVACMAGCARPCVVAFQAAEKAAWLFGDMDPQADVDDLVAFARQYRDMGDGWCSSGQRPGKLRRTALARVPAAPVPAGSDGKVSL
ncbi:DUF1636 family protein [Labrenzia sp. 011]|uniref:DUF1636 family protein n=1 Tax=Labrenzia sp. 011 TaxID=2171494 RepID=UPI000D5243C1|nr:DUF1636 family protein [Labrenzia sp. 011]PVB61058.1 hypothetical protein DCO57_14035 [Labrenzia sp. 011]